MKNGDAPSESRPAKELGGNGGMKKAGGGTKMAVSGHENGGRLSNQETDVRLRFAFVDAGLIALCG